MITAQMPTYALYDVAFESGEGVYLKATDGRRFTDFGSGIAVVALGHAHPRLVQALTEQAGKLWHVSNLYHIPVQERLAQRLVDNTFADCVFFCNSGAEAVEAGLKIMRRYHQENGRPDRYRVITCTNSFHGRTLTTVAASKNEKHMQGFAPMPDGFDQVPLGNLNELRAAITEQTAGIIVEPVQGEGGIHVAGDGYLRALREAADEFGVLLMFDEVQTGVGRTGKLFAYEWSGVEPDVMSVAKGLGGGFPVGACLANEKAGGAMAPGSHGSTFGGNPLAMSVADAVIDELLKPGFLDHVDEMAGYLRGKLEDAVAAHPKVLKEVRGKGLLMGIECHVTNGDVVNGLFDRNVLVVPAGGNVVRFIPPLIVEESHIDEVAAALNEVCAEMEAQGETSR